MGTLSTYLLVSAAAFASSTGLTPLVRRIALRRQLVDSAGGARKIHARAIPRLGGAAIVAGWLISIALGLALSSDMRAQVRSYGFPSIAFVAGAIAVSLVGLVDDVHGLRARNKLAGQLVVATFVSLSGFSIQAIQLPGGLVLSLGAFAVPLTVVWMIGVMNAVNLIDGLDGLAGGVTAIAAAAVLALLHVLGKPLVAMYSAALLGAVGGFLVYNFNPASIFMGDAGSLFLGYFLAIATVVASRVSPSSATQVSIPLVVLAIPILDTLLAIVRRTLQGRPIFHADKEHIHHRLLALGLSQRQTVLLIYAFTVLCAGAAMALHLAQRREDLAILGGVAGVTVLGLRRLGVFDLDPERLRALLEKRESNLRLSTAISKVTSRIARAADVPEIIDSVQGILPALEAKAVTIHAPVATEQALSLGPSVLEARFALRTGSRTVGDMRVVWSDGRDGVHPDHALAIEHLCENIARAVSRLSLPGKDAAAPLLPIAATGTAGHPDRSAAD